MNDKDRQRMEALSYSCRNIFGDLASKKERVWFKEGYTVAVSDCDEQQDEEAEAERLEMLDTIDLMIADRDYAYEERDRLKEALEEILKASEPPRAGKMPFVHYRAGGALQALTPHEFPADSKEKS